MDWKFDKLRYSFKNFKASVALVAGIVIISLMPKIAKEINIISFVDKYREHMTEQKEVFAVNKITEDEKTDDSNKAIDKEIEALCTESLNIQYKCKTQDMEKVYTKEFISNIGEDFYWNEVSPYEIKNIGGVTYPNKDKEDIFYVRLKISDRLGEYYEEINFKKQEGKLFIDNIQNDI